MVGLEVSPKTLDDAWITNGMSRYGELMYVEDQSGASAMKAAMSDVAAGALAYDTVPLTSVGRLDPFSPQFQSMTLEKGAMIFHMLRWEVGDKPFLNILKGTLSQYAGGSIRTGDIEKVAEAQTQQELVPFFSQWIDGTGAPTFTNKYSVYRLGNNKGFRTIGEINQDLDLFRMPVDLRIETDGKTENKRIEVVGTDTQYVVDTFGRPRRISIDPNDWVLKATPDLQVRISILKGQQLVAQGDLLGAIAEYQKALQANSQSSLASYRIGEVLFTQRNYQASVNAFRDSLRGDDEPPWTEVWATSPSAKSLTLPASATAPSTSTAWPSRPTTTPRERSMKLASTCKSPSPSPTAFARTSACTLASCRMAGTESRGGRTAFMVKKSASRKVDSGSRQPASSKSASSTSASSQSAPNLIDARIKELGDWRGEMLGRLRALIKQADPDVVEEWKWGIPVWSHDGIISTGETYKKVVKMTFAKGAFLDDPAGLFNSSLEGRVRHAIDFREGEKINEKALKTLIRAAVALNKSKA